MFIEVDYTIGIEREVILYRYGVILKKDITGKYVISNEKLSRKKEIVPNTSMETVFEVIDRKGMIEGSPFNVDSIDFIGVFGAGEEDE